MGRRVGSARKRVIGRGVLFASIALGVGSTGCTGVLEGNPLQQGSVGASSATGGNGSGAAGGASGGVGAGAGSGPGGGMAANAPGYKPVHRLSAYEYNATVADVLGTALQPANGSWQVYEVNGFDNMADVQHVDEAQAQRFFDAAGALADDALARADFTSKYLSCSTSDD
ncbi:MAG TPA: DUF1587 domain-containing protein, partial [Polyangiaceae bacterium]|nr:DUF1587 domain-containing protein [Polyangiaceae bacterium]